MTFSSANSIFFKQKYLLQLSQSSFSNNNCNANILTFNSHFLRTHQESWITPRPTLRRHQERLQQLCGRHGQLLDWHDGGGLVDHLSSLVALIMSSLVASAQAAWFTTDSILRETVPRCPTNCHKLIYLHHFLHIWINWNLLVPVASNISFFTFSPWMSPASCHRWCRNSSGNENG